VCGIVKSTRDRTTDLGGGAIPCATILAELGDLASLQERFHRADRRWRDRMSPEQRTRWPTAVAHNPFYAESREPLGRDEEIRRIKDMLCAGNHCSIVGPPGSGKTLLLKAIRPGLSSRIGCRPEEVSFVHFRGITRLVELQEVIVDHLGGTKANEWRRLLTYKPLRLLVLDDLGGMDPGARGRNMRRWLRSLYDSAGTKLRRYRTGATLALGEATEQCLEPRERRAQRSLDGAGNGGPHAAARRVRERRRAQQSFGAPVRLAGAGTRIDRPDRAGMDRDRLTERQRGRELGGARAGREPLHRRRTVPAERMAGRRDIFDQITAA